MGDTEAQRPSSPESQPEARPSSPAKRPGVSRGAVIALVVGLVALLPLLYFSEVIVGAVRLQAWSKAGAISAVKEFVQAVESGDEARVQAFAGPTGILCTVADGRITAVKTDAKAAQKPSIPTEKLIPTSYEPDADSRYIFSMKPPVLVLVLPAPGGRISFDVTRTDGKWVVMGIMSLSPRVSGTAR